MPSFYEHLTRMCARNGAYPDGEAHELTEKQERKAKYANEWGDLKTKS